MEYDRSKVRSFSAKESLWKAAQEKAKLLPVPVSISAVIRVLLEKWVNGEIEL